MSTRRYQCCIPFCKPLPRNSYLAKQKGNCHHRFPLDVAQCQRWLDAIKETGFKPFTNDRKNKSYRICSRHFTPDDYMIPKDPLKGQLSVLKPSAIPSIFPKSLQERRNERDSLIETDDVNGESFFTFYLKFFNVTFCFNYFTDAYLCNECCFTSNIFQEFAQHIVISLLSNNSFLIFNETCLTNLQFTHDESEGETTEELEYEKDSSVAAKNLSNMPETLTVRN